MNDRAKQHLIAFSNIVLPLAVGAIIYAIVNPHIYAYKIIFGENIKDVLDTKNSTPVVMLIRCYAADMLWAYSFSFYLQYVNRISSIKRSCAIFLVCILIVILVEIIQMLPCLKMTFDIWDIAFEIIAATIAYAVFARIYQKN